MPTTGAPFFGPLRGALTDNLATVRHPVCGPMCTRAAGILCVVQIDEKKLLNSSTIGHFRGLGRYFDDGSLLLRFFLCLFEDVDEEELPGAD